MFWVHASNAARVEQGYRDIAEQVKISGRNDPKGDIFQLVDNWLRTEKTIKWALILDNADDVLLFENHTAGKNVLVQADGSSDGATQSLLAHLPRSENGSILVTSRNKSVALQLVEESEIFVIEPMNDSDALALLGKKLEGNIDDTGDALELIEALEYMPLAIIQAAAYIRQRESNFSIREYLKDLKKNDQIKTSLLSREDGNLLGRDSGAKNSIMITWQISFDHILKTRTSAADLLSLMSFFDRQGIPKNLLKTRNDAEHVRSRGVVDGGGEDPDVEDGEDAVNSKTDDRKIDSDGNTLSISSFDNEFETDITTLRNYSFISISTDDTLYDMHRLVQLAIQNWLEARGQHETWKQKFIKILYAEFPAQGNYENWTQCQMLFPHVKSAEVQRPVVVEEEDSLWDWAVILSRAAYYLETKGAFAEAESMALKGIRTMREIHGQEEEEHEKEILVCMHTLAKIHDSQGRWKEAENLLNEVIALKTQFYGPEHVETASSMFNLASTYRHQGRWNEAETLQTQVLNINTKVLGTAHPHTLHSKNNLAMTHLDLGRWREAETLQLQVLNTHTTSLGPDHPFTLTSMNNLALNYSKQGRWPETATLQEDVMNTQTLILGPSHPNSLITMSNLAWTYRNQQKPEAAELLLRKVLSIQTPLLGAQHPSTLITLANLASIFETQQRWPEAEEIQLKVLNTHKTLLGTNHPHTLTSMNRLASTYWNINTPYCLKEAEMLQKQVLDARREMLGAEHPDSLTAMNNLAHTFRAQGRVCEAVKLLGECVEVQGGKLGWEHPYTRDSRGDLEGWVVEMKEEEEEN